MVSRGCAIRPEISFWTQYSSKALNEWKQFVQEVEIRGFIDFLRPVEKMIIRLDESSFSNSEAPSNAIEIRGILKVAPTIEIFEEWCSPAKVDSRNSCHSHIQAEYNSISSRITGECASFFHPFYLLAYGDLKSHNFQYAFSMLEPDQLGGSSGTKLLQASDRQAVELNGMSVADFASQFKNGVGSLDSAPAIVELSSKTSKGYPRALNNLLMRMMVGVSTETAVKIIRKVDATDSGFRLEVEEFRLIPPSTGVTAATAFNAASFEFKRLPVVKLADALDPLTMQRQAVNLNIDLMKWRIVPSLDVPKIQDRKILLVGSGTLGCAVSRALLGWGVKHFTFVDKGKVSYSNPVRQTLFTFQHAADGVAKVHAATESLLAIRPDATVRGEQLSIPMPGHHLEENWRNDVQRLAELFEEHDTYFFLTDNPESRWLPTLLAARQARRVRRQVMQDLLAVSDLETRGDMAKHAAAREPVALTVALGFDSLVVQRHSFVPPLNVDLANQTAKDSEIDTETTTPVSGSTACYFCEALAAPTDSVTQRTLDMQCTVTRPGVSGVASSLAVELLANLVQNVDGAGVNSPHIEADAWTDKKVRPLGAVPAALRLFLNDFSMVKVHAEPQKHCTCCSPAVVDALEASEGVLVGDAEEVGFLGRALREPEWIEEISGLAALKAALDKQADEFNCEWDGEDADDF